MIFSIVEDTQLRPGVSLRELHVRVAFAQHFYVRSRIAKCNGADLEELTIGRDVSKGTSGSINATLGGGGGPSRAYRYFWRSKFLIDIR
jgi:hypothetical protein